MDTRQVFMEAIYKGEEGMRHIRYIPCEGEGCMRVWAIRPGYCVLIARLPLVVSRRWSVVSPGVGGCPAEGDTCEVGRELGRDGDWVLTENVGWVHGGELKPGRL